MHALTRTSKSLSRFDHVPRDRLNLGCPSASIMSDGPPSAEGYDSADATFNDALQIDMKGLFGDTVGNVSYTRQWKEARGY